MKTFLLLLILQLSPNTESVKEREVGEILNKIYDHSHLLSADQEAEKTARNLMEKYPDDPFFYNLWASTEWLLIGRELNLKADEQKDISAVNGYKDRAERYRQLVERGLTLAENKTDEKTLFARALLQFDQAKFSARYESRLAGLKRADQEGAEGIKLLRQIININPKFCSAYFFLGANRLQLSTKPNLAERFFVWKFSKIYAELYSIDNNVFDEKKSIEWLEKSYHYCGFEQPWLKKTWIETSFLLIGAYRNYHKNLGLKEEMYALPKEVSLLRNLGGMFPHNQDLSQMLTERELRLNVLQNYFSKK